MKVTVKTGTTMDGLFFFKEIPHNEADLKDKTLISVFERGQEVVSFA